MMKFLSETAVWRHAYACMNEAKAKGVGTQTTTSEKTWRFVSWISPSIQHIIKSKWTADRGIVVVFNKAVSSTATTETTTTTMRAAKAAAAILAIAGGP